MVIPKIVNRKILNLALLTVLLGVIAVSRPFAFSSSPMTLYISPQPIFVEEDEIFSISMSISNVPSPGMYAYQIRLYYDTFCLEAISAGIPEGHFMTPSSPSRVFIVEGGSIDKELGRVSFAITLLSPEQAKTGNGIVASVEFKAIAAGNSQLMLADVKLVDSSATEIPSSQYVIEDGTVNVASGTPPPPSSPFKLYVNPELSFAQVGDKLSVKINIAKAPLPGIFAYTLSLNYNATVLQAITAGIPNHNFLETSTPETLSIMDNGTIDNVLGAVSFDATRLTPEEGKTGNGALGFIEFVVAASGKSTLEITAVTLADKDDNVFPSTQYEQIQGVVSVRSPPDVTPPDIDPPILLPTSAVVYVDPVQNPVAVDDSFEVNIFIANMSSPGLFSYQLRLSYDCTLLEAVDAFIPEGHFLTPMSPAKIFIVENGKIDNSLGKVSFALTLLNPEQGRTGDGVLATVKFKAIADGNVTLRLEDVKLVGPDACGYTFEDPDPATPNSFAVPEFSSIVILVELLLFATLTIVIMKKAKAHRFT